jgi:hypothetical protein
MEILDYQSPRQRQDRPKGDIHGRLSVEIAISYPVSVYVVAIISHGRIADPQLAVYLPAFFGMVLGLSSVLRKISLLGLLGLFANFALVILIPSLQHA